MFVACVICSSEHPYVVIMANKRWTSITGYEQHEVEGKTLSLLHGQWTDRDTLRQMMEDVRYGGFGHCTVVNYTKEGKPFLNRISIQPLLAGRQGERNKPLKISHFLGKSVALEIDKNVTLETLTQQMKDDLYWMETNVVSDREANSSSSGDENSSIDSDENNEKHFTSAVKNRGKAGNPSVVSNNSPSFRQPIRQHRPDGDGGRQCGNYCK